MTFLLTAACDTLQHQLRRICHGSTLRERFQEIVAAILSVSRPVANNRMLQSGGTTCFLF
jgi:hypothetical protein